MASQTVIVRFNAAVGPTLSAWARRNRLKALYSLARHVDPVPVADVTADQLARWLGEHTPRTRDLYLSHAGQFFAWALEHKIRKGDPAAEVRLRGRPVARAKPGPGTLEHLAFAWVQERRTAANINPTTARQQRGVLLSFVGAASSTDPAKVTKKDVLRWMAGHEQLGPNTRRLYFAAVRQFLGWLVEEGHLRTNPMRGMKPPAEVRSPLGALDADQVRALVEACEDDRETMVLAIGLHAGLRRTEIAALEVGDVSLAGRTLTVRRGKGGNGRIVPLSDEACRVVGRYLADNGLGAGPLLRSHRYPQRGICPSTVGRIMRELALRAEVKVRAGDGISTHTLRRTMATDVYAATTDVLAVRDLLGHALLNTTERYIKGMATERMRAAVEGRSYIDSGATS